jgi:hypothetical protein
MNPRLAALAIALLCIVASLAVAAQDVSPFLGRWALTIPSGRAGWLEVTQQEGYLDGRILWGGGSVVPLESVYVVGDTLHATRIKKVERKDKAGTVIRTQQFTETITAKKKGADTLALVQQEVNRNGAGLKQSEFSGNRIPDLPAAPDLASVKFGAPAVIFNGVDLSGWSLIDDGRLNGWSVKGGLLVNNPAQEEGKPHKRYGNLRTDGEFEDFNLTLDVNVPAKGNSGVYLRGVYEVQVMDSYGMERDPHHMGGVYSRITPLVTAEKPPGEWQKMDITLVARHLTVKLNGKLVIDNHPLLGCTGGALTSDEFSPGPIYLQGDHTGVKYRNIVLRPVVK